MELGVPHDEGLLSEEPCWRLSCEAGSNQAIVDDMGSVNAAISKVPNIKNKTGTKSPFRVNVNGRSQHVDIGEIFALD
jgi:hypothetical protein